MFMFFKVLAAVWLIGAPVAFLGGLVDASDTESPLASGLAMVLVVTTFLLAVGLFGAWVAFVVRLFR